MFVCVCVCVCGDVIFDVCVCIIGGDIRARFEIAEPCVCVCV